MINKIQANADHYLSLICHRQNSLSYFFDIRQLNTTNTSETISVRNWVGHLSPPLFKISIYKNFSSRFSPNSQSSSLSVQSSYWHNLQPNNLHTFRAT